jgi:hypothetical protein
MWREIQKKKKENTAAVPEMNGHFLLLTELLVHGFVLGLRYIVAHDDEVLCSAASGAELPNMKISSLCKEIP